MNESDLYRNEGPERQENIPQDLLPKDIRTMADGNGKEVLEKAGIQFISDDSNPELQRIHLPDGWKIVSAGSSRLNNLIDHKGRVRAEIIYGGPDLGTFMTVVNYYGISTLDSNAGPGLYTAKIKRCDDVIHTITVSAGRMGSEVRDGSEINLIAEAAKQAKAWLTEKYPDWTDANAYWDDSE